MARIKMAYLGGGSTRAAGTMASFIHHRGADFDGSEIALIDIAPDRLSLVETLARKMARARGLDIAVSSTTDRRAGLDACDAVLSSFRPGGFEARALDERTANAHGLIGQETQGVGGFFMALRAIEVMKAVAADIDAVCPHAKVFNYTNPVNVVAQAWTSNCAIPLVSLCEGPYSFTAELAQAAGLDPERVTSRMIGLNHACWSVEHAFDGGDLMPYVHEACQALAPGSPLSVGEQRLLRLASAMESIPADYFLYYYWRDEVLAEQLAKPKTRAEDILSWVPGYWDHYAEQAETDDPVLDPARSRGGIHELELAIDAMHAVFNDTGDVLPVNVPNRGSLPGFCDDLVVEVTGRCDAQWVQPLAQPELPRHLRGLVEMLAEYQMLAAEAAWSGTRRDAIRALAANPLVLSVEKAEAVYAELSAAHRAFLPDRLLAP
ncbi:Alpha-galactosidases/6-phospho-beta-glucosidase-related glycosyl hydrolase [Gaiella occulta]|uniref:Alpha-galactosidases/6-phospho-beta-glucosidase-related glycosyl hydrolase n=1 Tax=Gaiella occulta TaxID=1002870 RepID=A0A7M2YX68_9ACTN|nr:glycoside hydrolase [Gaiella occulta]RDI74723.1 Alpha-galactosidases/6-phospho-beta-glucosidase-related glycosyl hydrolase [Gaiella occulta]